MNVVVAGGFDPIHKGHIDHIRKAAELGDLTVIVQPDAAMVKKKGYCFMPLEDRIAILESIRWVKDVVVAIDDDGTVTRTLRFLQPDFFAKGGDRTPQNMPNDEVGACYHIGCRIVYGVGDTLNSSSEIVAKARGKKDARTDKTY